MKMLPLLEQDKMDAIIEALKKTYVGKKSPILKIVKQNNRRTLSIISIYYEVVDFKRENNSIENTIEITVVIHGYRNLTHNIWLNTIQDTVEIMFDVLCTVHFILPDGSSYYKEAPE